MRRDRDGHAWHKSSYSSAEGSCVEVTEGSTVAVRDTQNRGLGHIMYSSRAWAAFVGDLRHGLHD